MAGEDITRYCIKDNVKEKWYWVKKGTKEVQVQHTEDQTEEINIIKMIYPAE